MQRVTRSIRVKTVRSRTAFTRLELLITFALFFGILVVLLPVMSAGASTGRRLVDAAQIKRIHEGLVLWASSNSDDYPVPFDVDRGNTTIASSRPKQLTRHIVSILLYNGYITPPECVSPAETSRRIAVYARYQYSAPAGAAAADKRLAAWDPFFRATSNEATLPGEVAGTNGGLSYAVMPMAGARRSLWKSTARGTQAMVGNRGPDYTANGSGADLIWTLAQTTGNPGGGPTPVGTNSLTLRIHGAPDRWEGNIAYNDGRVEFETSESPATHLFSIGSLPPGQQLQPDNLFENENDQTRAPMSPNLPIASGAVDGAQTNNYLRTWTGVSTLISTGEIQSIQPWYD